jgi:hypothetical protein
MNPFCSEEYKKLMGIEDPIIRINMLLMFHEKIEQQYNFKMRASYNIYYTYKEIIEKTESNQQARSDLLFDYHIQFDQYNNYKGFQSYQSGKYEDQRKSNFFSILLNILFKICDSSDA